MLGMSRAAFERSIGPVVLQQDRRAADKGADEFSGPAVVEAMKLVHLAGQSAARLPAAGSIGGPPGDELLWAGLNSPALERFRTARAQLAEMEVEQKRGNLIDRSDVRMALTRFASVLRRGGELLQRQFGPEALAVFEEAIAAAERAAVALLADDREGPGTVQS